MSCGFERFEEKGLYFQNATSSEVLKECLEYRAKWEKDGSRTYVNRMVMHPARLEAWTGCVVTMMDIGVGRGAQRKATFTELYGSYLRCGVAGRFRAAWMH